MGMRKTLVAASLARAVLGFGGGAAAQAPIRGHEEMADKIDRPLIQSIYNETGFDPARL